ncbi:methylated-DNA--[protein]-cysteine S-methyltransferase [Senegalia massiliensis]|uniref:methylated-DNA--[protein]-cysteine S-methyltransferase n=1 Tax=Senegalia massiliensis TaxID=1720316 RepID=UPI00325B9A18
MKENLNYILYLDSPIGIIEIEADNKYILSVNFVKQIRFKEKHNELNLKCKRQLEEYFDGNRKEFFIPIKTQGTKFQEKVWNALRTINYGEVCSYGDIAKEINNKKAYRAVGNANNKNNISIIIPCHRVIGSNGKLVGYGSGLWRKQWLIDHERKNKDE